MDYLKENVETIYAGTDSVVWSNGTLTYAKRAWTGKDHQAILVTGSPSRQDPSALYLSKGSTLAPRSMEAVCDRCGTSGRCLLHEKPHKMAKKCLRLSDALANMITRPDFRLFLTNILKRTVNLPNDFAEGLATPSAGPILEISWKDMSGPCGGADPVITWNPDRGAAPDKAELADARSVKVQAKDASLFT